MIDRVVIDSSALIDGATGRNGTEMVALEMLEAEYDLHAPALLAWELGHVITSRWARHFGRTVDERIGALEDLVQGIELHAADAPRRAATARLAERAHLTFYDAAFLALAAESPTAPLVTHDAALRRAAAALLGDDRALTLDDAFAVLDPTRAP